MEQNNHGGDLYKTSMMYGIKEEEIIDFSANINPLGLSRKLKETLISNIDRLVDYPDPECNNLRNELSQYLHIPKEFIIAGNGASEIIYLLFNVLKPSTILMPAPCFAEYARAADIYGAEICYYKLKEEDNFRLKIQDFLPHITDNIDTILLCNPNNPTSALIAKEDLLELIEYAQIKNVNVIIDEAFIELTIGGNKNSITDYLQKYNNLFVIRALTKILSIPGLRLGYALGNAQIIIKMCELKIPWSVNTFACNIGKVFTENQEYLDATTTWLTAEKEWLYNELSNIPNLKIFEPDTNFILIKLKDTDITSSSLKEMLILKGILIRDASNFQFLDNHFFRVAIKDRKSNIRLVEVLSALFY